jgi:hypothetical protein
MYTRVNLQIKYLALIIFLLVTTGYSRLIMEPTCYIFSYVTFAYEVVDCEAYASDPAMVSENSDSLMFSELLRYSLYAADTAGISLSVGYGAETANSYFVDGIKYEARIGGNSDIGCVDTLTVTGTCVANQLSNATFNGPLTIRGDMVLSTDPSNFIDWVKVMGDISVPTNRTPHIFHDNLFVGQRLEEPYRMSFLGDTVMMGGRMTLNQENTIAGTLYLLSEDSLVSPFLNTSINAIAYIDSFSAPKPEGAYVDGMVPQLQLPKAEIITSSINCSFNNTLFSGVTDYWTVAKHNQSGCSSLLQGVTQGDILFEENVSLAVWSEQYGDDVLPPGRYGSWVLSPGSKLILGEGKYYFEDLIMAPNVDGTGGNYVELLYRQPEGARTEIFINNTFHSSYGGTLAPESEIGSRTAAIDVSQNKGGSALVYYNGTNQFYFAQNFSVWATVIVPNAAVSFYHANKMFGQIWAWQIGLAENFDGNEGVFIPYYPEKPKVRFAGSANQRILEGDSDTTELVIPFSLDHINGQDITVYFHIDPSGAGMATPGEDYAYLDTLGLQSLRDSVVIPALHLQADYTINIFGDLVFEANEIIQIVIDSVKKGDIAGDGRFSFIIENDDEAPIVQFAQTTYIVAEDTGTVQIPVYLNTSAQSVNATIQYQVRNNTASNADHGVRSGSLVIAAGDTLGFISMPIVNDGLDEPNEDLTIAIIGAGLFTIGADSIATITILDNDDAVGLADNMFTLYTVDEGDTARVIVRLDTISGKDITIDYEIADSSTAQGADYVFTPGTLTIPAGQTQATISIPIVNDIFDELREIIWISLFNPVHVELGSKNEIQVQIRANDPPIGIAQQDSIPENPAPGAVLGQLQKAGPDTASYNFVLSESSPYYSRLQITAGGLITVLDSAFFDYEVRPVISVPFVLQGPNQSATVQWTLFIEDVVENPTIVSGDDPAFIKENSPQGTPLDTVIALPGAGDSVWYYIIGGDGQEFFTMDSVSGIITVAPGADLDYERDSIYTLQIIAKNASGYTDSLTLPVRIINVIEITTVHIIEASTEDSIWANPDTVWVREDSLVVTFTVEEGAPQDTLITTLKPGKNVIIITRKFPDKDEGGADTLYVYFNNKKPEVVFEKPEREIKEERNTVIEKPDSSDTWVYINDPDEKLCGSVDYIDKTGSSASSNFCSKDPLTHGKNTIVYSFTDAYGNIGYDTISVILDTIAPVVKILSPENKSEVYTYVIDVLWTVDGDTMSVFVFEGVVHGNNMIVRSYVDKAGNRGADTVFVQLDEIENDVKISLETGVSAPTQKELEEYRKEFPQRKNETYSLNVLNHKTGQENEVMYGDGTTSKPSDRIKPSRDKHIGPTLIIDVQYPHVGGTNRAGESRGGTLSDLVDGLLNSEFGEGKTEAEIWEYVLDGADRPANPDTVVIWDNQLIIEAEMYDNSGQWVDRIRLDFDEVSSEYLDDEGNATFFLTLEPHETKGLVTQSGRSWGTGAYIMRGYARSVATLKYNTAQNEKGFTKRSNQMILQTFGYRRDER